MTVHHFTALCDRVRSAELGTVKEKIRCHRVRIRFYDTGDKEKHGPKQREERHEKRGNELRAEIIRDGRFVLPGTEDSMSEKRDLVTYCN